LLPFLPHWTLGFVFFVAYFGGRRGRFHIPQLRRGQARVLTIRYFIIRAEEPGLQTSNCINVHLLWQGREYIVRIAVKKSYCFFVFTVCVATGARMSGSGCRPRADETVPTARG
jgi:hypothetical protein